MTNTWIIVVIAVVFIVIIFCTSKRSIEKFSGSRTLNPNAPAATVFNSDIQSTISTYSGQPFYQTEATVMVAQLNELIAELESSLNDKINATPQTSTLPRPSVICNTMYAIAAILNYADVLNSITQVNTDIAAKNWQQALADLNNVQSSVSALQTYVASFNSTAFFKGLRPNDTVMGGVFQINLTGVQNAINSCSTAIQTKTYTPGTINFVVAQNLQAMIYQGSPTFLAAVGSIVDDLVIDERNTLYYLDVQDWTNAQTALNQYIEDFAALTANVEILAAKMPKS